MPRESLSGEEIVWIGGPKSPSAPGVFKLGALVSGTMAATSVVIATSLRQPVGGMILFAAWSASLALAFWRLPLWFRASAEYIVTENRVIWRRGRLRRSIDRAAISYAVVRWKAPGIGDLVLERAVPTGALRRTLSLTLADVEAPDRLWAIVRGLVPGAPLGDGRRPLAQRLDDGERVLWSARPGGDAGAWGASHWTTRRIATAATGLLLAAAAVWISFRSALPVGRILRSHALAPATAATLVGAVALVVLLLSGVAVFVGYTAVLRPWLLRRETRYFVTDRRVLIRRGSEELHLDRGHIAYVITAPWCAGSARRDLYLVLDGPQARAFLRAARSGAATPKRASYRCSPRSRMPTPRLRCSMSAGSRCPRVAKPPDVIEGGRGRGRAAHQRQVQAAPYSR